MKKIIYRNPNDACTFDIKRFVKSLERYAKVSEKEVATALEDFEQYETMHVSCLVEVGMRLIAEKKGEAAAKEYFKEYAEYFDASPAISSVRSIAGTMLKKPKSLLA